MTAFFVDAKKACERILAAGNAASPDNPAFADEYETLARYFKVAFAPPGFGRAVNLDAMQGDLSLREAIESVPRVNSPCENPTRREGDELICFMCNRRWGVNDERPACR